ncbi:MAG TPA: NINE protein [Ktedonobacterales bacterium]|jgi:TM2 domain-containing membrane protein YozV|nr:NINE protein [Ktedonobacterales bacterium]
MVDTRQRDEIRELAKLTAHLNCAQQTFFQAEYGRHRRGPTMALVLCLLLGGFGAHELYFGRHRSGILRLLFCWTLIPAVLALFDLRDSAARARRYNAALGQRILLALEESAAEVAQEKRSAASAYAERDDVRIGTAEYDISDGSARLRRVSEQLAAALTLERARQVTQPRGDAAKPTPLEVASEADVRLAATTAPIWEADLPTSALSDEEEPPEPHRVPVLSYSVAAVRRDPVRFGPPLPVDAALPAAWVPERTTPQQDIVIPSVPQPAKRRHMQRIIVRKMALQDGKIAAEAVAERMVELEGTDEDIEMRVQQAMDEARREALRRLALTTTGDVSEAAWSSLRQHYPDADLRA